LLLHGWISENKPVVQVLTDGSGHSGVARLEMSTEFLRAAGARTGVIFGRLTDREAYAMILDCDSALLLCLVNALASDLRIRQPRMIVTDAVEGYNPVHDLCRMIAGAAIELAGIATKHYEYAVVNDPDSFVAAIGDIIVDLDDVAHTAKVDKARASISRIGDIAELFARHGTEAYRRERLHLVEDWTSIELQSPRPLYESFGEQRVAASRYSRPIRRGAHMLPLRDALCAAVEKRACAF
jgi:hypothetical protein